MSAPGMAVETRSPGASTLPELAATVRREHEQCVSAMKTTVEHAIRAGEALLEARERTLPSGDWMAWLQQNFPSEKKAVYRYMRLATYQHLIPSSYGVTAADNLVRGLPSIDGGPARLRVSDARKDDAKQLRNEGLSYKEIAKQFGVSVSSVHGWINSGTRGQREKRARVALRREEKAQAIKRAVGKAGDAIAEAYSLAERMDDVLGQAHREATNPEARRELARAHEFHRAMRDSIVRGLGVA